MPQAKSKTKANSKTKSSKAAPAVKAKAKPTVVAKAKTVAKTLLKAVSPKKAAQKIKAVAPKKAPASKPTKTLAKADAKKAAPATAEKMKPATVAPKTKATSPQASAASVFTPLDDRILVERTGVSDRTPGGLYIPETVSKSDRPTEGRVVAVGRGHRDKKGRVRPLDVQMGDTVMFASYAGSEVMIGSQELTILREQDLIAIVK